MRSKRTALNAAGTQALFAVHHCGKNSQAELDSFTIGQLSVSRGSPPIERAVSHRRGGRDYGHCSAETDVMNDGGPAFWVRLPSENDLAGASPFGTTQVFAYLQ